jgi:hypothetical protein
MQTSSAEAEGAGLVVQWRGAVRRASNSAGAERATPAPGPCEEESTVVSDTGALVVPQSALPAQQPGSVCVSLRQQLGCEDAAPSAPAGAAQQRASLSPSRRAPSRASQPQSSRNDWTGSSTATSSVEAFAMRPAALIIAVRLVSIQLDSVQFVCLCCRRAAFDG